MTPTATDSTTLSITPRSIYDEDVKTARTARKRTEVLGGYDPADYETQCMTGDRSRRHGDSHVDRASKGCATRWVQPRVVVRVRFIRVVDGSLLLIQSRLLLDRGVVFAIGHIRGGSERGRQWYEDGKFLNSRNTFEDFISCGEAPQESGWAAPDRIAIQASAGGLLIAATINMRPDLFCAAHAGVPFVDVMNTMLDPSIPLTVIEYEEWGNPNDPVYYEYMKSYSPYDNVTPQAYPDLLVTAGLNDPRVHYWEPAKWTARLRDHSTGDGMLIMKTNMACRARWSKWPVRPPA